MGLEFNCEENAGGMMTRALTFAATLSALSLFASGVTRAQHTQSSSQGQQSGTAVKSCLHGAAETADQAARRREALGATRTINNIQANRLEARDRKYLRQDELAGAPFAVNMKDSKISLNPSQDILPGWKLTLDVAENGYWFMVKDTTDPCGYAFISNQNGVIFTAEPLR